VTAAAGAPDDARFDVAFVTANTFEFDSRTLRTAAALAASGLRVVVVAQSAAGLARQEVVDGVVVRRPFVERRISGAFRPLPGPVRSLLVRALGIDRRATVLRRRRPGLVERLRAPLRRAVEILAYRRRIGPWTEAVLAAAPGAGVFAAKALVALPVAAGAARRVGGRYVYDVADLHVESGRLARLPGPLKAYLHRREGALVRGAAALTASTPAMSAEVARRYGAPAPLAVLNVRPRWRPDEPDPPRSTRLAEAAGIPAGRPVLLYQGAFREGQGIEMLLAAVREPILHERPLTTVFMGFGTLEAALRAAAARDPRRIVVLPAVPSDELLEWTCGATVSFVGAPPITINQRLTAPNKLFESLMAGVPVVVAAGTATAQLVEDAGAGTPVAPWTPAATASAIAALLDLADGERLALRRRIRAAALKRFSWETLRPSVVELYQNVAGGRP
jgi:glycosyltransferase involved in cell wall biosynthesis